MCACICVYYNAVKEKTEKLSEVQHKKTKHNTIPRPSNISSSAEVTAYTIKIFRSKQGDVRDFSLSVLKLRLKGTAVTEIHPSVFHSFLYYYIKCCV